MDRKFKVWTLNKFLLVLFLLSVQIAPAAAVEVGASDTVRASNDTGHSTGSGSYERLSIISPIENTTGSVRITYDIKDWDGAQNAYGQLKKNGVNIGTEYITNSGVYVTRSEDISITLNTTDTLELWAHTVGGNGAYVRNFRLKYDYNYSSSVQIGGVGYNWTANGTFNNVTWDRGTSELLYGNFYHSFAVGSSLSEFRNTVAGGACTWSISAGSRLYIPNNTTSDLCVYTYMQNYTNAEVRYKGYVYSSDTTSYQSNGITRYTNSTSYERLNLRKSQSHVAIYERVAGTYTTINISSNDPGFGTGYWFNQRFQTYGSNLRGASQNGTVYSTIWNNSASSTNLTSGELGIESDRAEQYFDDLWIVPLDGSGNVITSGNYSSSIIYMNGSDGRKKKLHSYRYNGTNVSGEVKIYINTSDDGVVWTGESLLATSPTNGVQNLVPSGNQQYRVRLRFNVSGNDTVSAVMQNLTLYGKNTSFVSGYVKFNNGTGISGATVGYFGNWSTTGSGGYYELIGVPTGNISVVAGLNGYWSNGTILPVTSDTNSSNINLTLTAISPIASKNLILNQSYNISMLFLPYVNSSGYLNGKQSFPEYPESDPGNIGYINDEHLMYAISVLYARGYNYTPEFFERVMTMVEYHDSQIRCGTCLDVHLHNNWVIVSHLESVLTLKNVINPETYNRWNETLINYEPISIFGSQNAYVGNGEYTNIYREFGTTSTGFINNYAPLQLYIFYKRYKNGNINLTTFNNMDANISSKYLNQTDSDGWLWHAEENPSVLYNTLATNWWLLLFREGYQNQTVHDRVNASVNISKVLQTQDGNVIDSGRNYALAVEKPIHIVMLFSDNNTKSENYRRADKIFFTLSQFLGYNQTADGYTSWYTPLNYHSPVNNIGGSAYYYYPKANMFGLFFLTQAGVLYDSSVFESEATYSNHIYNESGFAVLNSGNYSLTMYSKYYPNLTTPLYNNFSGLYPLRFAATVKDALNKTIMTQPEITVISQPSPLNTLYFDSGNTVVNFTKSNFSKISSGVTSNLMFMNWSEIWIDNSGNQYQLDYVNISTVVIGDRINVSYKIGFSNFSLTNYRIPLDILTNDNRTAGTRIINGNDFDFVRGKESLGIRNLTGVNVSMGLLNTDVHDGWSPYGLVKRTFIFGTVTPASNTFSVMFDLNISTTNTFGYAFNQPP